MVLDGDFGKGRMVPMVALTFDMAAMGRNLFNSIFGYIKVCWSHQGTGVLRDSHVVKFILW